MPPFKVTCKNFHLSPHSQHVCVCVCVWGVVNASSSKTEKISEKLQLGQRAPEPQSAFRTGNQRRRGEKANIWMGVKFAFLRGARTEMIESFFFARDFPRFSPPSLESFFVA